MVRLTPAALERLRESLRARGARASIVLGAPGTSPNVVDAMHVVSEYGALSEAMFLVMLSDKKVRNVEREVLRGALRVLSGDNVRSSHIESMLDAAARNVADEGFDTRLAAVIEKLRDDTAKAELAYVLATAIAAADGTIVPEEQAILTRLAEGLGIEEERANKLLAQFDEDAAKTSLGRAPLGAHIPWVGARRRLRGMPMAKLYFRHGTMQSAKTLNLLAVAHNYRQQGKRVLLIKPRLDDRFGAAQIASRAGLGAQADLVVDTDTVLDESVFTGLDCVLVDEAQFLSPSVVEQLRRVTLTHRLPVICYGLRTDFRTRLFPGSRRLLELADSIEEIKVTCQFCNKKAIFNIRIVDGVATAEGAQVLLGAEDRYAPVCHACYEARLPIATLPPEGPR